MAHNVLQNLTNKRTEYNRYYTQMRGVDMTGDGSQIDPGRFSYLENMYRDYDAEGAAITESVPGFRKILALGDPIYAIHTQKTDTADYLILHAGSSLYRLAVSDRDSDAVLTPIASVAERASTAFACASSLFVLDGTNYLEIKKDGSVTNIATDSSGVYVPTTYRNGEEYEQRNLLSPLFREIYDVPVPQNLIYESPGLKYTVTDAQNALCEVSGRGNCTDAAVWIPACAEIDGKPYTVHAIGESAFASDGTLTSVYLAKSVRTVRKNAFYGCSLLRKAVLPSAASVIEEGAFGACCALSTLHLGIGLTQIAQDALTGCSALQSIGYEGSTDDWSRVQGNTVSESRQMLYQKQNREIRIRVPLFDPVISISSVKYANVTKSYTALQENGKIVAVSLYAEDERTLEGIRLEITGTLSDNPYTDDSHTHNFLSENRDYTDGAKAAILGCRVCEVFDGRVFLCANPKLPNTVFYTARDSTGRCNPTYFGILNYFQDGVGNFPVCALLCVGDSLAVFKSGDDGNGSIYYHAPESTGNDILPKVYPVRYIHCGIRCLGQAASFYDDPVFISENGLCALEKKSVYLEKSVSCRSHFVNSSLLCEHLEKASLTKWNGYLAICCEGNIYLADGRQTARHPTGATQYEWFFLRDIGTWKGDAPLYRFSCVAPKGYRVYAEPEAAVHTTVYSDYAGDDTIYYAKENGIKYAVHRTAQRVGGSFSPAVVVHAVGDLLFFGTAGGDVCVFNNDRRGIPPPYIREAPDFDAQEYARCYGRRIHPDFYSFDGHAPRYALKTRMDNCSIPHLLKDTVHRSLVIKCRSFVRSRLTVEVGTDRAGYREVTSFPGSEFNFSDMDFAALSTASGECFSLPLAEKERGWVEKQITVYSDAFCAPFGIYSISYRFTVRGNLKKP